MSHGIVIGGSIAGLVSARVLLNHFDHVTLIERDQLPDDPTIRPGVPQASHVHVLLLKGYQLLEEFFPGLSQDLRNQGALRLDWIGDWHFLTTWDWLPEQQVGLEGLICSRLLLEWYLHQCLQQEQGFCLKAGSKVQSLLYNNHRITGITFQNQRGIHTLDAELVVDASGRNSQLPHWLQQLGYKTVPATKVNPFLGYASRWYQAPAHSAVTKGIMLTRKPGVTRREGVLYPIEGNRWVVTLSGVEGDYPTADDKEFLAFAKTLRHPMIYEAISSAQPISPIRCYRGIDNCWHHYETLSAMPEGIVTLGDAVCAFNPAYGQGMTVAAMEAKTLDHYLSQMSPTSKGFSLKFQREVAKLVKLPWLIATGEDFRWEATTGKRPGWFYQTLQRYFDQVTQLANKDLETTVKWVKVMHLVESPTQLFRFSIIKKVIAQLIQQNS